VSSALFIVLERAIPGVDSSSIGGNSLSRNLGWLDEVARNLNVRPLSDLISVDPKEAAAFLEGEGETLTDLPLPSEEWFHADDGLRTVEALLNHAKSASADDQRLLRDLTDCKHLLDRAREEGVRFHFAVDF